MLKALGIGKTKQPKEDDVKKASDQNNLRSEWKRNAARLQAIIDRLNQAYSHAKGDFAVGRYEELKKMIKESIQAYRQAVKDIQELKLSGHRSAVAAKYERSGGGEAPKQSGLAARLKQSAESFALHDEPQTQKDLSEMTAKELEAETAQARKDVIRLKGEYYTARDKLEWLAKEYEASKKHNPTQRYTDLKNMIKRVTRGQVETTKKT